MSDRIRYHGYARFKHGSRGITHTSFKGREEAVEWAVNLALQDWDVSLSITGEVDFKVPLRHARAQLKKGA